MLVMKQVSMEQQRLQLTSVCAAKLRRKGNVINGDSSASLTVKRHFKDHLHRRTDIMETDARKRKKERKKDTRSQVNRRRNTQMSNVSNFTTSGDSRVCVWQNVVKHTQMFLSSGQSNYLKG